MERGRGSRRRNPGHTGGPYRLLFLAVCLLFLFFALYAGKRLIGGEGEMETEVPFRQEAETEEDIKGKTAETEKAGEKTEEQTERETERPVLQIYTGEENEEKEDTGEKENAEEQTLTRQADTVSLLFAGDIYLSEHVLNAYERGGGIEGVLDSGFLQTIEQADIFMANQEFPFSSRGTPETDKQFTFRLPEEKVSIMQEIGPDIVALANNHALDYGSEALSDTIRVLDEAGILHAGAGENLDEAKALKTIEAGGKTFGFLAASRVFPKGYWAAGPDHPGMLTAYDSTVLLEEIQKAKESCDFLTVYVHWGIERRTEPESYQRTLGQQYIDAGADLVIGSHPHVLQGIEYYKGKPIVYSLGNFIFGSSIPKTALLAAEWDGETTRLSLIPGTSSAGYTRMLTDEKGKAEFYDYMTGLSFGAAVDENGRVSEIRPEEPLQQDPSLQPDEP